ncbi:DUF3823 domain-containing protein [Segetibacter aerophilus]|uniref:DUF3823 domain-containing protein n=1 Tax=Segetibacter aerophilus TaxID=670293 RepID=A0A512B752_9BACT|nr:DUF3823 domain-containing protein [Segetibacter aerophilus]GEO07790.1 hypothetical protein SAE01_02860 [Segetibacter aerophilus]
MKIYYTVAIAFIAMTALSCKKDNYTPPSRALTGKLVYKGEPLQLQYNQVGYELYQYGFGLVGAIGQFFTQEGNFSSVLFPGDYKLTVTNGSVPFIWNKTAAGKPDSIGISLNENKNLNIEVTPYYMIRTPQLSASGGKVKATFKVEKVVTDIASAKDIDKVVLLINKTAFVSDDGNERIASTNLAGTAITDPNNISMEVPIPTIVPAQNYVFARVGLRIKNLNSYIFSPVQKITF